MKIYEMAEELSRNQKKRHETEENGDGVSSFCCDVEYVNFLIESRVRKEKKKNRRKRSKKTEEGNELAAAEEEEEEEEEDDDLKFEFQDPLVVFGHDIMQMILGCLDARSVALSLLVSRAWYGVACSDRLWAPKCQELWLGKAHIPRISKVRGLSRLAAYSLSAMDGKRIRITRDDLCDHVWEFHFTETAPGYWRELDPYWKGTGRPMRRYFLPDGSQIANPDDEVWGGHEACYCVVTGLKADGSIREHYVRINRLPRMSISRNQDWSWEMGNNLCHYSSLPDADKEDGTGPFYAVF